MFTCVGVGWKETRNRQSKTCDRSLKSLALRLSHVDKFNLTDWGLRDYHTQWLETGETDNNWSW